MYINRRLNITEHVSVLFQAVGKGRAIGLERGQSVQQKSSWLPNLSRNICYSSSHPPSPKPLSQISPSSRVAELTGSGAHTDIIISSPMADVLFLSPLEFQQWFRPILTWLVRDWGRKCSPNIHHPIFYFTIYRTTHKSLGSLARRWQCYRREMQMWKHSSLPLTRAGRITNILFQQLD